MLCHAQLFATPGTAARQAPLSIGFPRQKYWSGLPFPSPRHVIFDLCHEHLFILMRKLIGSNEFYRYSTILYYTPALMGEKKSDVEKRQEVLRKQKE